MTTYERIRRIFLQPERSYRLPAAAGLLGYSDEELIAAIDSGDISVESTGGLPTVTWEEVAWTATGRWPQEMIEEALGRDVTTALPELVRLTDLHVRVPRFDVIALGRTAQRGGTTANALVARELLELAVAEAEALERSIPGIAAAIRWPLS